MVRAGVDAGAKILVELKREPAASAVMQQKKNATPRRAACARALGWCRIALILPSFTRRQKSIRTWMLGKLPGSTVKSEAGRGLLAARRNCSSRGGAATSLGPRPASTVCTLLAPCDRAVRGQLIRERVLDDDESRLPHQPCVNRNVRNSRLNPAVLKLIFASQIDALHKNRRAFDQVPGLANWPFPFRCRARARRRSGLPVFGGVPPGRRR